MRKRTLEQWTFGLRKTGCQRIGLSVQWDSFQTNGALESWTVGTMAWHHTWTPKTSIHQEFPRFFVHCGCIGGKQCFFTRVSYLYTNGHLGKYSLKEVSSLVLESIDFEAHRTVDWYTRSSRLR